MLKNRLEYHKCRQLQGGKTPGLTPANLRPAYRCAHYTLIIYILTPTIFHLPPPLDIVIYSLRKLIVLFYVSFQLGLQLICWLQA